MSKFFSSLKKIKLLPRILIAIVLGVVCSFFFGELPTSILVTLSDIFAGFLKFVIPLIILGLVAPGIASIGTSAGRMLGITLLIAYGSTLFAGFFSFFTCDWIYPMVLVRDSETVAAFVDGGTSISSLFSVPMPPLMDVMSALILSFVLGVGCASIKGNTLKGVLVDFEKVIIMIIEKVIIPLLPFYIFVIFLQMGVEGKVFVVLGLFVNVIIVVFAMHILLLLFQFALAGFITKRNPLVMLKNMLPAYVTALGTQSSAATIPVTLECTHKNGVDKDVSAFVVPLCATVHLAGSILKIVACAAAIMYMSGMAIELGMFAKFIMLLGITMVAAPGVPGGAIMAALGLLQLVLGFDETLQALMIALYIAMDSFGTACNVTGDGAITSVVSKLYGKKES